VGLLILSDIHANLPALQAVLAAEPAFDALVFCGDVVDYGPFPVECVRWLAAHPAHAIRGNHDNALAFDQDCHCMGSSREASLATRAWHKTLLGEEELAFLRRMPTRDFFEWRAPFPRIARDAVWRSVRVCARGSLGGAISRPGSRFHLARPHPHSGNADVRPDHCSQSRQCRFGPGPRRRRLLCGVRRRADALGSRAVRCRPDSRGSAGVPTACHRGGRTD
jgi:hypothetical protein